ncbi:t(6)A37 threonylcarbamoyladenosine biosynthesis protein [Achromobacter xylosoxidans]|nr:t(6)A37 threonylcarbamoyladenosine biosynthesis protein [Achromobacter xylosoxidans]
MIILGFESSCDETGVAAVCTERGLLAHALHTQIAMHQEYGAWCLNSPRATISAAWCR